MKKIAVLGANGQVGSEVSLLLGRQIGIETIPICRTVGGSAFLRHHGFDCRHGRATHPEEAKLLVGDADMVLNFALAHGLPRDARRAHRRIIANSFDAAPRRAIQVYFSTMAVYGSRGWGGWPYRGAYAREKLFCERRMRRARAWAGQPPHILRLGHVCGELQNITGQIRERIAAGPFALARGGELPSNTVYTATIVEAVLEILAGRIEPGTFDLVTYPEWTWRQVYEHEAEQIAAPLDIEPKPWPVSSTMRALAPRLAPLLRSGFDSPRVRDLARAWLARLPGGLNLRLQASYRRRRARQEIAALSASRRGIFALPDPWRPRRPIKNLTPPDELRQDPRFRVTLCQD